MAKAKKTNIYELDLGDQLAVDTLEYYAAALDRAGRHDEAAQPRAVASARNTARREVERAQAREQGAVDEADERRAEDERRQATDAAQAED